MSEETSPLAPEGADFHIPRIANGVRLYLNANEDHGILQIIGVEDPKATDLEALPPVGEHVIAQIAYDAEQLSVLSYQLQALAQEIARRQEAKREEADGEAKESE
jgi:hypothetical protein